jgi:hypothetical protein
MASVSTTVRLGLSFVIPGKLRSQRTELCYQAQKEILRSLQWWYSCWPPLLGKQMLIEESFTGIQEGLQAEKKKSPRRRLSHFDLHFQQKPDDRKRPELLEAAPNG